MNENTTIATLDQPPASAIDVRTEIAMLRNRRCITRDERDMAEQLFTLQLAATTSEAERGAVAAHWLSQLAALAKVSV